MDRVEVVLFDVNETLLDMRALDPYFERLFEGPSARERWFEELKGLWLVTIATGSYRDFSQLAPAALQVTAEKDEIELSTADVSELLDHLTALPAHPDAAPALTRLEGEGLRLAALTNGTSKAARAQLQHAELAGYFEEIFSVDEVKRYKPAPEPYEMAAARLGVNPEEICMVACHSWDIAGAGAAGLAAAFVRRPRKVLDPLGPEPDLQGEDLLAVAEQIVGHYR